MSWSLANFDGREKRKEDEDESKARSGGERKSRRKGRREAAAGWDKAKRGERTRPR